MSIRIRLIAEIPHECGLTAWESNESKIPDLLRRHKIHFHMIKKFWIDRGNGLKPYIYKEGDIAS